MMPFALGIVSGKIFDNGGFYKVEVIGCTLFAFSWADLIFICKTRLMFVKTFHAIASKEIAVLSGELQHIK